MNNIQKIQESPVYKQILADSFGGIMYNVANQKKYDAQEIIQLWDEMGASYQTAAGGIMKGAIQFLKGGN